MTAGFSQRNTHDFVCYKSLDNAIVFLQYYYIVFLKENQYLLEMFSFNL